MIGGFNGLDIFIFALVIVGIGVGLAQGLLRQVIGLAALYIGAILGAQYYSVLSGFLRFILLSAPSKFLNALSFFIILIAVYTLINLLANDAYQSTKLKIFPGVDQLGGALVGLVAPIITLTLALPVLTFATSESWPFFDQTRFIVIEMLETSRFLSVLEYFKPIILSAIGPWLPAGLPALFNL